MSDFNLSVTVLVLCLIGSLWGVQKWNAFQDKNKKDMEQKKISDRYKWM